MLKKDDVKKILEGKHLLVVEDDEGLSYRLVKEFERCGVSRVAQEYAVETGLRELNNKGTKYDLIVVDVMLPKTEDDFRHIQDFRKELKECRKILREEDTADPGDGKYRQELAKARERWRPLNEAIALLIRKEGGIEMVKQWLEGLKGERHPPILYLTAVGNPNTKEPGLRAVELRHADWLVKPVTVDTLVDRAAELIAGDEREQGPEVVCG
jgi:DNA-binding response OmpR family regulator